MADEIGNKSQIDGSESWILFDILAYPRKMPKIPAGHTILCGLLEPGDETERIFACKNLPDVQMFCREKAERPWIGIQWYHTNTFKSPAAA